MKNIVLYKKGEQSWIRYIQKRIKNNLNFLALAQGSTGIGKSWAMIKIAYDLDNSFEARQIAFNFKQVMEIINSDWFKKKKIKIIVFDEAQIDISNRQWQSLTNKLMNYLLSTFRHQNIILLFTSPYVDFLDSSAKKLIHCVFDCKGWDKKTSKSLIRPKLQQYNAKMKKMYEHSLYVIRDGKTNKFIYWKVGKPPEHLIIPYEKAKIEFTNKLNKSILEELNNIGAENNAKVDVRKELNPDSMQPVLWVIAQKGYKTQQDLADKLGKFLGKKINQSQLNKNIMSMRFKGWDIRQYKTTE